MRGAGIGATTGSTVIVRDGPSSDATSRSAGGKYDPDARKRSMAVPRRILPAASPRSSSISSTRSRSRPGRTRSGWAARPSDPRTVEALDRSQRTDGRLRRPTRTMTRAGRVGNARDRKSRTGPRFWQNGQVSRSDSRSGSAPSATGASQRRQASVPTPSRLERLARLSSSYAPAALARAREPAPGDWPGPRKSVTRNESRPSDREPR
jgi:hypothetical protein